METPEKALIEKLALEYPELATMVSEHKEMKAKLEDMNRRPYLAPEEDLERKRLQKAKLSIKDKIHAFVEEHKG